MPGWMKRNALGQTLRDVSGLTIRTPVGAVGVCGCCETSGPCAECDGGGASSYNVEVTSAINLVSGCKNTGLGGYASITFNESTIPAGTSWCVPNLNLCVWEKVVTPSPVTGTKYSLTNCNGTATPMTSDQFTVRLDRDAVFPINISFGPFRLLATLTLPSAAACFTGTFNNPQTTSPSGTIFNTGGYGGTIVVTAGCEEDI